MNQNTANVDLLNSWKEIAEYMGRGVRTVQRWEQDLAMPVRRPRGTARSAVFAIKIELDQWMLSSRIGVPAIAEAKPRFHHLSSTLFVNFEAMLKSRKQLRESSTMIRQKSMHVRVELKRAIALTQKLKNRLGCGGQRLQGAA